MNVSTYSKKYGYAVSYFNLSTALVLMERRGVTHPVKKVLLVCYIPQYNYLATLRLSVTTPTIAVELMAMAIRYGRMIKLGATDSKVDVRKFC